MIMPFDEWANTYMLSPWPRLKPVHAWFFSRNFGAAPVEPCRMLTLAMPIDSLSSLVTIGAGEGFMAAALWECWAGRRAIRCSSQAGSFAVVLMASLVANFQLALTQHGRHGCGAWTKLSRPAGTGDGLGTSTIVRASTSHSGVIQAGLAGLQHKWPVLWLGWVRPNLT